MPGGMQPSNGMGGMRELVPGSAQPPMPGNGMGGMELNQAGSGSRIEGMEPDSRIEGMEHENGMGSVEPDSGMEPDGRMEGMVPPLMDSGVGQDMPVQMEPQADGSMRQPMEGDSYAREGYAPQKDEMASMMGCGKGQFPAKNVKEKMRNGDAMPWENTGVSEEMMEGYLSSKPQGLL